MNKKMLVKTECGRTVQIRGPMTYVVRAEAFNLVACYVEARCKMFNHLVTISSRYLPNNPQNHARLEAWGKAMCL